MVVEWAQVTGDAHLVDCDGNKIPFDAIGFNDAGVVVLRIRDDVIPLADLMDGDEEPCR